MVRIDHVSEALNGTVINCTEAGLNLINPDTSATTVQLVDQQQYMNGEVSNLIAIIITLINYRLFASSKCGGCECF